MIKQRVPTARGLQDVEDWFGRFERWDAELLGAERLAWRFKVSSKVASTQVLVPFDANERELRRIANQLSLYFGLMG